MTPTRRKILLAVAVYLGVGLVTSIVLLATGPRSDIHWLATLLFATFCWPALLFGTLIYFLTPR